MADPQQQDAQALPIAPFPAPPPFWKHFSSTNLQRLETLKTEAANTGIPLDLTTLPLELRYLLPPPPPPPGTETYTTFHETHVVNPTSSLSATANIPADDLANLLITPKPTTNIPLALKSLTNSLLLTFLQLTQMLSQDPTHESRYELLEHIKRLFVNIHVLINSYRPHQAREGVINMLKDRIEDARGEITRSNELRERVEGFLKGLEGAQEQDAQGSEKAGTTANREEELNKKMWRMIWEVGSEEAVAPAG
jgi:mediator of RNA polymerase II transcription subunit 7